MKVSILINNYNYSKYLKECIDSLFNQTYENIEVVVYDDGSKDNSLEILEQYKEKIKVIANTNYGHSPNENQAHAIYQAFINSTGEIICLLDSDDMFDEKKVEKVVEVFKKDRKITTVQNLMLEMDHQGKLSNIVRPVLKEVDDINTYIFKNQNFFHLFVPTSGLTFRRAFLDKVLPLKEDGLDYIWPDIRLLLFSVFYGKIDNIMEPLTYYRIHGQNDSNARGTIEGHSEYLKQAYLYFNSLAKLNDYPYIEFSKAIYLENTYFSLHLNKKFVKFFVSNYENVYIWGAGEAGQSIFYFLEKEGISSVVKGFFDINTQRFGEEVMGLNVSFPIFSKGTKCIISPIHAYDKIKKQLEDKGFVDGIDFIYPYNI